MKELFLKYFGRLLAIIGCSTVVTACYGTPFEVYSAKGRVIDAETEEPIMGIKVQITPEGGYGITEANGSFEVRFTAARLFLCRLINAKDRRNTTESVRIM